MKRLLLFSVSTLLFACYSVISYSQDIVLSQINPTGIYKKGQNISVAAQISNAAGDSLRIRVLKNNNQLLLRKSLRIENGNILLYEGIAGEPCSIIIEARTNAETASLGLIVNPEELKPGFVRPKDFDSFWRDQKKNLKELKWDITTKPVVPESDEKGFNCVDIEINCTGPKPVRGYFAKPVNAAPKSLPVVLLVHAAGVKGSWCRSEIKNAMNYAKKGALCFDLNAHGMLNGQPESYYAGLEAGELKDYFIQGVTNRDEFYFRGMYLRLLRTIDFLAMQPEWDGKRILVIGESQGGGQALVAAGLDKRVSAVVAIVPAMCDWFGPVAGRKSGWPQPFESKNSKDDMMMSLPYYDAANILKDSKAIIFTEIGLIDMTCPSTSVYAAVNQAKGKKYIYAVPYRPHQQPQRALAKTWETDYYKPREQFISDYLK